VFVASEVNKSQFSRDDWMALYKSPSVFRCISGKLFQSKTIHYTATCNKETVQIWLLSTFSRVSKRAIDHQFNSSAIHTSKKMLLMHWWFNIGVQSKSRGISRDFGMGSTSPTFLPSYIQINIHDKIRSPSASRGKNKLPRCNKNPVP